MGEKDERTVRIRPEDLPDPNATRIADPDATRAAKTSVAARVPAVDAAPATTRLPERDGIDALSDPYFSPAVAADLTTARPVVSIDSPVESLPERKRRLPRWALVLIAVLVVAAAAGVAYLTYASELWGGKTVPEVVGLSEQDARERLEAAGFAVKVEYRAGDGDFGTVLSVDPAEGVRADPAAGVTLVVAGERVIPSVVGLSEEEATQALYDAGAANVVVARQNSDEAAGTVLAVDPAEGSAFVSTDEITLTVAQPYTVPELTGMAEKDALAALEEAGLAGTVSYVESDAEKGTVVGADPVAGTEVAGGTSVTLSVSSPYPAAPARLLEYFDLSPQALATYLGEEGFTLSYGATFPATGNFLLDRLLSSLPELIVPLIEALLFLFIPLCFYSSTPYFALESQSFKVLLSLPKSMRKQLNAKLLLGYLSLVLALVLSAAVLLASNLLGLTDTLNFLLVAFFLSSTAFLFGKANDLRALSGRRGNGYNPLSIVVFSILYLLLDLLLLMFLPNLKTPGRLFIEPGLFFLLFLLAWFGYRNDRNAFIKTIETNGGLIR